MSAQRLPQGHQTDTLAEIPGDGWWEIAKRVRLALTHNHFSMIAAGVAFFAMLSIFPALAALVSLYGLVDSPAHVQREIAELQALLPGEASRLISEQLQSIVHSAHSELDLGLLIGFAISRLERALRYCGSDDRARLRVQRGGNARFPVVPGDCGCTHNRGDSVRNRGARVDCSFAHDARFSASGSSMENGPFVGALADFSLLVGDRSFRDVSTCSLPERGVALGELGRSSSNSAMDR